MLSRLLERRPDGHGRYYQFLGFDSRRYKTYAVVMAVREEGHAEPQAELVLPEWHPARPVLYPARLLPVRAQKPGQWMTGTADLSQGRPAWLNFLPEHDCPPPLPDVCYRPTYEPLPEPKVPERPTAGKGCGDIMLELVRPLDETFLTRGGLLDVFVIERPTGIRDGDRVYLARGGIISSYLEVRGHQLTPNGDFVRCEPEPRPLPRPIPVKGRREANHWRWRWWTREIEEHGTDEDLAAIADQHDPVAHNEDFVLTHRIMVPRRHDHATAGHKSFGGA